MKLVEMIAYLEEGMKVRKSYWDEGKYIRLSSCGIIVDQLGRNTPTPIDLRDVWELYKED